jgi:hypothetical protein
MRVDWDLPDTIECIEIPDRETWLKWRTPNIGASEAPGLFNGVHPRLSAFRLFGLKTGQIEDDFPEAVIDGNSISFPVTDRGLMLESVAIEAAQKLMPHWQINGNPTKGGHWFRHKKHRIASTPDTFIFSPDEPGVGTMQIKVVADMVFRKNWMPDGFPEPPLWVVIQAMLDAALSGCSYAYVGAFVIGDFTAKFYLFRVPFKPAIIAKTFVLVDEFWARVASGENYDPNFSTDADAIAALYGDDNGSIVSLTGEKSDRMKEILVNREVYKAFEKTGSDAEKSRKLLDAEIVYLLGNATGATLSDGRIVLAPTTKRKGYEVKPSSYRSVKIKASGVNSQSLVEMPESF